MPNRSRLIIGLFLCSICSAALGQAQQALSQDPLGVAMDEARAELLVRRSWAKDIPPVVDARRKGNTLLIGIGTPASQDSTQWKAWWEQTICEAPELKKILLLDGGVLAFSGPEPNRNDAVSFNKGDCYGRIPGWNRREGQVTKKEPYKVEPQKPTQSSKAATDPSKAASDDPLGLVSTFTKLNDIVIENQLRMAERPETAARIAVFKRNLFGALLKEGFTKAEAIAIINNTPIPSLWK